MCPSTSRSMPTKQNKVITEDIGYEKWKSLHMKIRNPNQKAEIINYYIKEETAYIEFKVEGFTDEIFTQKMDATLHPNEKSEFEEFLQSYGYTPYESHAFCNQQYPLKIDRNDDYIELYIPTSDRTNRSENTDTRNEKLHITGITVSSIITGLIPIINIAVLFGFLRESLNKTNTYNNEDIIASIGFTIGTILSYLLIYLFYI